MRRWCVLAACLSLIFLAAVWLVRHTSPPVWKERLEERAAKLGAGGGKLNPESRWSVEYQRQEARLEQLLQRSRWGAAEVDVLLSILDRAGQDLIVHDDMAPALAEQYFLAQAATEVIGFRIGVGAPVEPAQRERLITALLSRSKVVDPGVRHMMAQILCWSGLIFEDERVDARVKEMMQDPDPTVAMNAKRQYRWHSSNREKYDAYQRRLGRLQ